MPQAATIAAISGNYRVCKKIRPIIAIGCTLYVFPRTDITGILGNIGVSDICFPELTV